MLQPLHHMVHVQPMAYEIVITTKRGRKGTVAVTLELVDFLTGAKAVSKAAEGIKMEKTLPLFETEKLPT